MPAPDCAWTLRVLAGHLDAIVPLRARPAELAWAKRYLREREAQVRRPVEFAISPGAVGSRAAQLLGATQKLPASGDAVGSRADELMRTAHKLPSSEYAVSRIASLDDGAFSQAMERIRTIREVAGELGLPVSTLGAWLRNVKPDSSDTVKAEGSSAIDEAFSTENSDAA